MAVKTGFLTVVTGWGLGILTGMGAVKLALKSGVRFSGVLLGVLPVKSGKFKLDPVLTGILLRVFMDP